MRVAVMQPYFLPYAGYFRLFAAADLFVILDTVQFPRRGWVHRNRLPDVHGRLQWLTLPLRRVPRDTAIRHICFAEGAADAMRGRMRRFPHLRQPADPIAPIVAGMPELDRGLVDYLEAQLRCCCERLGLATETVRASTLGVPRGTTRQQRMIEIVHRVGGTVYINAPGGRELYDAGAFAAHGIELRIHAPWQGDQCSVLASLASANVADVREAIVAQSGLFQ